MKQKTSLNYVYESRDPEGPKRKRAGFQKPSKNVLVPAVMQLLFKLVNVAH